MKLFLALVLSFFFSATAFAKCPVCDKNSPENVTHRKCLGKVESKDIINNRNYCFLYQVDTSKRKKEDFKLRIKAKGIAGAMFNQKQVDRIVSKLVKSGKTCEQRGHRIRIGKLDVYHELCQKNGKADYIRTFVQTRNGPNSANKPVEIKVPWSKVLEAANSAPQWPK